MSVLRESGARNLPRVRKVLIVDDDDDSAELLERAVQSEGHETRVAHDAPAALRLALEFEPHVAILDIDLPGMDGFELARALRANSRLDGCRFVAVTGHDLPHRHQHDAPIFNAHLVKPVNVKKLQRLVLELDYFEVIGLGSS